jgi:exosortase/archaeosortase family protein
MLPIVGLVAALYWRRLAAWEDTWYHNSAWSHCYLIPLIAILIAHFRLKEYNPQRVQPSIWGLSLILTGLVVRVWCQMMRFGYPGELTFVVVVAGVVLLVLGRDMFKVLWVPVAYLALMIPWDPKYYDRVALPLQQLAAWGSEQLLPLFGYTRIMPDELQTWTGTHPEFVSWVCRKVNVLHLSGGPLSVAGPCAGLHLLFAFVSLGIMMAFIYKRPLWERFLIMASSIPIAVFCNVVRVLLMALASDRLFFEIARADRGMATWSNNVPDFLWKYMSGTDVVSRLTSLRESVLNPDSFLHQSFGFVVLGLAIVLMWLELGIIDRFFIDDDAEPKGPTDAGSGAGAQAPGAVSPAVKEP